MNGIDKATPFGQAHVNVQEGPQSQIPLQRDITHSSGSPRPADKFVSSDKVDISSEAKAKLAEEGSEKKTRDAMQDLATSGRETTAAEEGTEIEKMIEELKEQVRELMLQLAQLKAKDDDASLAQQEALEAQIAALNSEILSLSGMKLEMLEQGK